MHLFGLEVDTSAAAGELRGVVYSWPATGGVDTAPDRQEIDGGWRSVGAWRRGAVVLVEDRVRLLEHGVTGWTERGSVFVGADARAAAVMGDSLVVLRAGVVEVYDVADPASPVLRARQQGSAYTDLQPLANGQVLLWSRRMATPPVRFDPATATTGGGFTLVIDGLP